MPLLSTHIFKKFCSFLIFSIYLHRFVEILVFLSLLLQKPPQSLRDRFPFLSPAVTSSPGAGEVFPQRESQAVKPVAKALGTMRKFPGVLLPLPLGEVSPQVTERAHAVSTVAKVSGALRKLPAVLLTERALPLPTQKAPLPCAESGAFFNLFLPGCGKPGAVLSPSYW